MNYLKHLEAIANNPYPKGFYPTDITFEFRQKSYDAFEKWVTDNLLGPKPKISLQCCINRNEQEIWVRYKKINFYIKNKNA